VLVSRQEAAQLVEQLREARAKAEGTTGKQAGAAQPEAREEQQQAVQQEAPAPEEPAKEAGKEMANVAV
jgi:hypothetical protein